MSLADNLRESDVDLPISYTFAGLVIAFGVLDFISSHLSNMHFHQIFPELPFLFVALALDFSSRISGWKRAAQTVPAIAYSLFFLATIVVFGVRTSNYTQAAAFPLQDHLFESMDAALGIDWFGLVRAVDKYPALATFMRSCYYTLSLQVMLPVFVLATMGRIEELRVYLVAFALSLLLTIIIAMVLPATSHIASIEMSAFHNVEFSGATSVNQLLSIRSGIDPILSGQKGLLSFPSFHTVAAILVTVTLRKTVLLPALLLINVGLLIGCVTEGAHYLADILSGAALAIIAYVIAWKLIGFESRIRKIAWSDAQSVEAGYGPSGHARGSTYSIIR